MFTNPQVSEIFQALELLPPDKVTEVRDFAVFLKERCTKDQVVDESDVWTEEDLHDLSIASAEYADLVVPWEESGAEESN